MHVLLLHAGFLFGAALGDPAASGTPIDIYVPGGSYIMGADQGGEQDEHPAHTVTVQGFWLDRTEVTHGAYAACVAAKACKSPSPEVRAKLGSFYAPDKPVSGVSWDDANAYCSWRGARLPTEVEFERAVRGDDGRRYPWGNTPPDHEHTVYASDHPENVGSRPAGAGPYGHMDLSGNVWEWVSDNYDPYAYKREGAAQGRAGSCPQILQTQEELRRAGRQGYTGTNPIPKVCERSIRGGAYNQDAHGIRSMNRVHHPGSYRLKMTGFRCARDKALESTEPKRP